MPSLNEDPAKQLDSIDRSIIELLQKDGRRPAAEIARLIEVSTTTVQRRIDRLVADGVIRIIALARASLVGFPVHVIFSMTAHANCIQSIEEALTREEEVIWVAWTTGSFDLIAEAFFTSNEHLCAFIQNRIAPMQGVIRVESATVLSLGKNVHELDTVVHVDRGEFHPPGITT